MLGLARSVSLLSVSGGSLWLIGYGGLISNSAAIVNLAFYTMVCGAILLGIAAAMLFSAVITWPSLRIIGLGALVITAVTTVFAIVLLAIWGDVDDAWGVIDPEWLMGWGHAAFMGVLALVSVAASRTARSWVEVLGWAAAVLGAAGQAVWFLAYVYSPREFGSASAMGDLTPIPIVLFGLAWIAIGVARMTSTGAENRLQTAL